jgi:predicted ATPase
MSTARHSAAASRQLMPLLERDRELDRLEQCPQRVATSSSETLALVAGEAGAGKTALVREFGEHQWAGERVLKGFCEPLAPRPLGPSSI